MRSEPELMSKFKEGEEATPGYQRERVMLEVMLDVRSLLSQILSVEKTAHETDVKLED